MLTVPLIGMPGVPELLIIAFLVMVVFGVGKLPEIGSAMGKAIKGFKDAQKDLDLEDKLANMEEVASIDEAEEASRGV